jgi:hypothetical protein
MSAKLCRSEKCGKLVIFAKDHETGKWQVLSNQAPVWQVIGVKNGVTWVKRDPNALISHFVNCKEPEKFSAANREEQEELDLPEAS